MENTVKEHFIILSHLKKSSTLFKMYRTFKCALINFTIMILWSSGAASIGEANTELRGNISISEELLEITSTPDQGFHRAILPPATIDGGSLRRESPAFSQDLVIHLIFLKTMRHNNAQIKWQPERQLLFQS